jgi:hypothetical protein
MHQWCDLSLLYRCIKEQAKHFVPNEALAAQIARVLCQTPGLHLSGAAVSAISGFASVYPAIKGSTTTSVKLGPALAASGSMGADGWPDGDAIIKTLRRDMPSALYDQMKDPVFFHRCLREMQEKNCLSDKFLLEQGVPPDEDINGLPTLRPSEEVSVHLARAHIRTGPVKRRMAQQMVESYHDHVRQKDAQARAQTDNMLSNNARVENALLARIQSRAPQPGPYSTPQQALSRKRRLSQASHEDFESITTGTGKVRVGDIKDFISARKYASANKACGFRAPTGNLRKQSSPEDKTLLEQAFELRGSEVKMVSSANVPAMGGSPFSDVASLPSIQVRFPPRLVSASVAAHVSKHIYSHKM